MERRYFLGSLLGAVAVSVLGASCQEKAERVFIPQDYFDFDDRLNASPEFRGELDKVPELFRKLIPYQDFLILLFKSEGRAYGNIAYNHSEQVQEVNVYLPDDSGMALAVGKEIVNHELVHWFDRSSCIRPNQYLALEIRRSFGKLSKKEFDFFRESTYSNHPLWQDLGHPQSGPNELLASAITVFRFHPEGFVNKVLREKPKEQTRLRLTAKIALDSIVRSSTTRINYEDIPIDPTLIDFLAVDV